MIIPQCQLDSTASTYWYHWCTIQQLWHAPHLVKGCQLPRNKSRVRDAVCNRCRFGGWILLNLWGAPSKCHEDMWIHVLENGCIPLLLLLYTFLMPSNNCLGESSVKVPTFATGFFKVLRSQWTAEYFTRVEPTFPPRHVYSSMPLSNWTTLSFNMTRPHSSWCVRLFGANLGFWHLSYIYIYIIYAIERSRSKTPSLYDMLYIQRYDIWFSLASIKGCKQVQDIWGCPLDMISKQFACRLTLLQSSAKLTTCSHFSYWKRWISGPCPW